jgi:hypothetical protein
MQELQVYRTWNVDEHPEWLVFEAEGLLQIRPEQYSVALDLMQNPGAINQLNMGEGKTRVIIPMLMLHWTRNRDKIVRYTLYFFIILGLSIPQKFIFLSKFSGAVKFPSYSHKRSLRPLAPVFMCKCSWSQALCAAFPARCRSLCKVN